MERSGTLVERFETLSRGRWPCREVGGLVEKSGALVERTEVLVEWSEVLVERSETLWRWSGRARCPRPEVSVGAFGLFSLIMT